MHFTKKKTNFGVSFIQPQLAGPINTLPSAVIATKNLIKRK